MAEPGNVRLELRELEEALVDYEQALALDPAHARALAGRGVALRELGRLDDARASLDRALAANPELAIAHVERARVLRDLKQHDVALESFAAAVTLDAGFPYALGDWVRQKLECCDWEGLDNAFARVATAIGRGERAAPFQLLALPSSLAQQQACARIFVADRYPATEGVGTLAGVRVHERLRVGYFSADFHDHATAHLIAEMLECHDRGRFEITAFSFGPPADDPWRRRVASADGARLLDVRRAADAAIAAQARARSIDLAIDLKGHTQHARPGIFAARAAPVQASWLGYPSTVGAPYVDYLIADATLVPPEHRQYYDEKIAYLPHSYQPNDSTKAIQFLAARSEVGLPQRGFVFCCFNHNYKITPEVFDVWMRVLARTDGSVLWLLRSNGVAENNLRREAKSRGISGERLIFAPLVPSAEHLARLRLADLFLDTLPCGAHTTASDALWSGVPVLTRMGSGFAGRVGASLLGAVGLPELVAPDLAAYETLALALAHDPSRLEDIRAKLAAGRATGPLFDARTFARDLERLYEAMIERARAGVPADHILPRHARDRHGGALAVLGGPRRHVHRHRRGPPRTASAPPWRSRACRQDVIGRHSCARTFDHRLVQPLEIAGEGSRIEQGPGRAACRELRANVFEPRRIVRERKGERFVRGEVGSHELRQPDGTQEGLRPPARRTCCPCTSATGHPDHSASLAVVCAL